MLSAASGLNRDMETARGGLSYLGYDVIRTYNVMAVDFPSFAALVSDRLARTDMRATCGMTVVRLLVWQHGLRLPKALALGELSRAVDVGHPHVDVLQVHRADTLRTTNGDAAVVLLGGRCDHGLARMFGDGVHLVGGTAAGGVPRYRTGFLSEYEYFARHFSPSAFEDRLTTFSQAYNSAAKMA